MSVDSQTFYCVNLEYVVPHGSTLIRLSRLTTSHPNRIICHYFMHIGEIDIAKVKKLIINFDKPKIVIY